MVHDIDLTYLKTVSNGDAAFELTMIHSLLSEIDEKISAAQKSLAGADRSGVRLQAHSLKNLFAIIGIEALRQVCLSLESNCDAIAIAALNEQLSGCARIWENKKKVLASIVADYESHQHV